MTKKLTPREDADRTIGSLQGKLSRLGYLRELRSPEGTYQHWGLKRTHGSSADQGLTSAHNELLEHILATPLRDLLADAEQWISTDRAKALSFLKESTQQIELAIPLNAQRTSKAHLEAVLVALNALIDRHSSEWNESAKPTT